MSLCDFIKFYVLAFGSHYGKGLGPISIKHGPLTILIYRTPTITFFYFVESAIGF